MKDSGKGFSKNTVLFMSAFLGALGVFGWAATKTQAISDYDRLYPYYGELCAVTQVSPANGKRGGTGGHAVLYLRGACRDQSSSYPRLRSCEGDGTAVSVDQEFQNVNWVAIDDRELFFEAGVPQGTLFDDAAMERQVQRALQERIFRGVHIHREYLHPEDQGKPEEEILARHGFNTSYGLSAGRNVYCSKVPLTRDGVNAAVDYLNALNDQFQDGSVYDWSAIYNNCAHVAHNALAAAGVWEAKKVDQPLPVQLFNLAVPSNEFIDLSALGNEQPLDDVEAIYSDSVMQESLLSRGYLPLRDGVVSEVFPIHQPNAVYDTKSEFIVLNPFLSRKRVEQLQAATTGAAYLELDINIARFINRVEKAIAVLERGEKLNAYAASEATSSGPDPAYEKFRARYIDYLKRMKSEAEGRYLKLQGRS